MVTAIRSTAIEYKPLGVTDLLATTGEMGACEYCGRQIRYSHTIEDDTGGRLRCGVCCARNLCEGYDGTEDENRLRNRWHRRSNWLKVKWSTSRNNNPYRVVTWNDRKYLIAVFPYSDRWKANTGFRYSINEHGKNAPVFPNTTYDSEDDAKLAAFDRLSEILEW